MKKKKGGREKKKRKGNEINAKRERCEETGNGRKNNNVKFGGYNGKKEV